MNKIKVMLKRAVKLLKEVLHVGVSKVNGEPTSVESIHAMRTKVQIGIDKMIKRKQEDTLHCIDLHRAIVTDMDETISANRERTDEKIAKLQEKSLAVTSAIREAGNKYIWDTQLALAQAQDELRELKGM